MRSAMLALLRRVTYPYTATLSFRPHASNNGQSDVCCFPGERACSRGTGAFDCPAGRFLHRQYAIACLLHAQDAFPSGADREICRRFVLPFALLLCADGTGAVRGIRLSSSGKRLPYDDCLTT